MPKPWISSKATLPSAWRDRCRPYNSCALPAMTHGADMDTYKTSTEFIERSMLNSTYNDIHTNKWAREGTKVVGIFGSVRKKWNGPGHGSSELSSLNPQFRQISVPFCSTRDVTVRRPQKFRYRPPGGATICRVWSPGVASRSRDVTRRL